MKTINMDNQAIPKPEFGSRPQDIVALNEAIDAINSHNDQFSLGKLMARAMIDQADKTLHVQELIDAGATQEEAEQTVAFVGNDNPQFNEEEQMARSIIGVTNAPILEHIGLTLSPLRVTSSMIGPNGEQIAGKVRLQLTDGGSLSNFLLSINPQDANEILKQSVSSLISSLIAETKDSISNDDDNQTTLETLAYGKGIIAGLKQVGLGEADSAKELQNLCKHFQIGDIKEYVEADRLFLFTEPEKQGFGPSKWHRDATSEYLTTRWNNVLDVLKAANANPKATELFKSLLISVKANLEYAKNDWAKLKSENYDSSIKDYGRDFDDIFKAVDLELNLLSSYDE